MALFKSTTDFTTEERKKLENIPTPFSPLRRIQLTAVGEDNSFSG